ncbi:MAG: response regulator [Desulfobacterium sp.]|nr:response regulator [Desulfobacterium sp.]
MKINQKWALLACVIFLLLFFDQVPCITPNAYSQDNLQVDPFLSFWNGKTALAMMGGISALCILLLLLWRHRTVIAMNQRLQQSIMERKEVETALGASEEKYATVVEQARDGVLVVRDGAIKFANATISETTGYTIPEVMALPLLDLIAPEFQETVVEHYTKRINGERVSSIYEVVILCKDGTRKPVELSAKRIIYQGKVSSMAIVREISDRKKAEKEKEELKEKLNQAYKMEAIGTLAGGIAHDFNNILSIIIGYTEMAMETLSDEKKTRNSLVEILEASNRARELVKQILYFSRKHDPRSREIAPQTIIEETLRLLRVTIPTTVKIVTKIDPECGNILADPTQIHQVVTNLATNAVHAMGEKGKLTITLNQIHLTKGDLSHRPDMDSGDYVRLTVSDTGPGISPETIDRIFEPFFTTKATGKGTGMGLAMVHGIVMAGHGMVTVRSDPGKGTAFDAYFPVSDRPVVSIPSTSPPLPTGNEHIMLVDDEQAIVTLGRQMLERQGYRITTSTDSRQALEAFRSGPDDFDLIITDQTMPHMSGIEWTQKILANRSDIPVILATGHSSMISQETFKEHGFRELIMKPFSRKELALAVRKVLDGK